MQLRRDCEARWMVWSNVILNPGIGSDLLDRKKHMLRRLLRDLYGLTNSAPVPQNVKKSGAKDRSDFQQQGNSSKSQNSSKNNGMGG